MFYNEIMVSVLIAYVVGFVVGYAVRAAYCQWLRNIDGKSRGL